MSFDEQALPRGWRWEPLEQVASAPVLYGILQPGPDLNEGVPYVRPTEIVEDKIDLASIRRTTSEIAAKYKRSVLQPNDIVLSIVGTIGKVALVPPDLDGGNITQSSVRVRVRTDIATSRFIAWALRSPALTRQYDASRLGTAVPRLNVAHVRALQVPLPSLEEQHRIVAEIEKQFTRLDAGVAALRRVQANLKRYRAAVLKAACEGRLVPTEAELARQSGRTYETGAELLARILTERRSNWSGRGKYKKPTEPDADGVLALPESWAWSSIDQLSSHITSGSRDWSQFYGRGTGTFILAQNVRPMLLDLTEKQCVDPPAGDAETERTRVQLDDLLVTIVGAKTGDVCRVSIELQEHFVCQSVALLRPVQPGSSKFATLYLASDENGQAQWKRYIYGQGRPHLSFEQLRMTAVPLPPLAEQARIVAEVDRRLSVLDELEALVSANLQRATRLRQSILQRAFSGELVKGT